MPTASPRRSRPRKSRLALIVIVLVGGFASLELGVRLYDLASGDGLGGHRSPLARTPKPVRPFRQFGEDLYVTRDDGVRFISSVHGELYPLRKPAGTYRVVVFGGSTTHNVEAWEAEGIHYPLELQRLLRKQTGREDIEVINVGFSAYSTAHSLDVLSWDPDLVILSHNTNDLHVSYFPDFMPDYSNKYGHRSYMGPDYRTVYTPINVMFQWSEAYWFLKDALEDDVDRSLQRADYPAEPEQDVAETFARNLRSFAALAKDRGIEVVFGSQARHTDPWRFDLHMGGKLYNDIVRYPEHDISAARHAAINRIMRDVAAETGSGFVDNSGMDGVDEYFTDHVHYTPAGIRVLAANYAKVLRPRVEAAP